MEKKFPSKSSSGRTIKPTAKFKQLMLDSAYHEYSNVYAMAKKQGQKLYVSMANDGPQSEVDACLGHWLELYEETIGMQQYIQNLVEPDQLTEQNNIFAKQMYMFEALNAKVHTYLASLKQTTRSRTTPAKIELKKEYSELKNKTATLEEEIKHLERHLSSNASDDKLKTLSELSLEEEELRNDDLEEEEYLPIRRNTEGNITGNRDEFSTYKEEKVNSSNEFTPLKELPDVRPRKLTSTPKPIATPEKTTSEDSKKSTTRYFEEFWAKTKRENENLTTNIYTPPPDLFPPPRRTPPPDIGPPNISLPLLPPQDEYSKPPSYPPVPVKPVEAKEKRIRRLAIDKSEELQAGNNAMVNVLEKLAAAIIDNSKKDHLPEKEPDVFDEDLIRFPAWLHSFETLVEKQKESSTERAYYLGVYTKGKAKESIQGILDSKADGSYERAKSILVSRYGDTFRTTDAFKTKLYNWPFVRKGDGEAMTKYADFLWQCYNSMSLFGNLLPLDSPDENGKLVRKLPYNVAERWARKVNKWAQQYKLGVSQGTAEHMTPYPPFVEFCFFVTEEAQVASGPISFMKKEEALNPQKRRQQAYATNTVPSASQKEVSATPQAPLTGPIDNRKCYYCQGEHHISTCQAFLITPSEKRKEFARINRLCFGCLKRGSHVYRDCKNRQPDLLLSAHRDKNHAYKTITTARGGLNTMIVPVVVWHNSQPDVKRITYAILDNQADCCLIKQSLLSMLDIDRFSVPVDLRLTTMSSTTDERSSLIYGLTIKGLDELKEVDLPKCYTRDDLPTNRNHIPRPSTLQHYAHLKEIAHLIPEYRSDIDVGLLLGYVCSEALFPERQVTGKSTEPFATKTPLGWGITGLVGVPEKNDRAAHFCHKTKSKELVSEELRRIFDTDFSGAYQDLSISLEDKRFMKIMEDGFIHLPNGHVQLPLPLKEDQTHIPGNKSMVLSRLFSLKKRFLNDEDFYDQFAKGIQKLIDAGFAEVVPENEIRRKDGRTFYLPIQGVWHPKKISDLRIVHDGGAVYLGISLNDLLLAGPDFLNNLLSVLCSFRERPFAFTCDIEKMFMQVEVEPNDRDLLRFLWFKEHDIEKEVVEMRMRVHLFGATSSPGVTNYALKAVAGKYQHKYGKEVSDFVIRHFYVDDGLKSLNTRKELVDMMKKSHSLCKEGGFKLHKYICNDKEAMESIPEDLRAKGMKEICFTDPGQPKEAVERTLGMSWQYVQDLFIFIINLQKKPMTRRGLLSSTSSIFDPMGLLAPVLIIGKLLLQLLCLNGLTWDDDIPEEVKEKWSAWYKDLEQLQSLQIPRCIQKHKNPVEFELHLFADASCKAYGFCAYVRCRNEEGQIGSRLMIAKAKVMPSKSITIPRLELQAAVMASKSAAFLRRELTLDIKNITLWTDSQIVLCYLRNKEKRFQIFVANRISQITELTEGCTWRHVKSEDNPADLLSRGCTPEDLKKNAAWWNGPKFLEDAWEIPEPDIIDEIPDEELEIRKQSVLHTRLNPAFEPVSRAFERVGSWTRLTRYVAIWRRYFQNLKRKVDKLKPWIQKKITLDVQELNMAESKIILVAQVDAHPEVFEEWYKKYPNTRNQEKRRKSSLRPRSNLYRLDVYKGTDGTLRVGGRLKRGQVPRDIANPRILPKNHHVSKLIVQHYHKKCLHSGRGITMNTLRQNGYWIINGRSEVAKFIRKCVICRELRGPTITQKMSDLPKERVEPSPPFTDVGADFFGPFTVKNGRAERKRWICAFTCFTTRAFHMEVTHSMSTDSFLHAYRRFVGRRGPARIIKCDRGTNFLGASNDLIKSLQEMNEEKISKALSQEHCDFISFSFNSPKASHMGGIWERMIRTARQGLNYLFTQHSSTLDDELFHTLVVEVEAVINSRPLTCVDMADGDDLESISPMQLLTLKHQVVMPLPGNFVRQDVYCRKRWKCIQFLANQFWIRWIKEFLPTLQERRKWQDKVFELKKDDIVLMLDENSPRNSWPKGIVTETIQSKDELVRRVKIRTMQGIFERPVHKLVFLFRPDEHSPSGEPS